MGKRSDVMTEEDFRELNKELRAKSLVGDTQRNREAVRDDRYWGKVKQYTEEQKKYPRGTLSGAIDRGADKVSQAYQSAMGTLDGGEFDRYNATMAARRDVKGYKKGGTVKCAKGGTVRGVGCAKRGTKFSGVK